MVLGRYCGTRGVSFWSMSKNAHKNATRWDAKGASKHNTTPCQSSSKVKRLRTCLFFNKCKSRVLWFSMKAPSLPVASFMFSLLLCCICVFHQNSTRAGHSDVFLCPSIICELGFAAPCLCLLADFRDVLVGDPFLSFSVAVAAATVLIFNALNCKFHSKAIKSLASKHFFHIVLFCT